MNYSHSVLKNEKDSKNPQKKLQREENLFRIKK